MARICYKPKDFTPDHQDVICHANDIIEEYQAQDFTLTLRQLYYQFVARDLIANTFQSYKRLGTIINDAKLAGEIDWLTIEDRTRNLKRNQHWSGPEELLRTCAERFEVDKWAAQPERVEVWIEKDALIGVIENVCRELDVSYFSCRGYTSGSELWRAAQRLREYVDEGQPVTVLHLGDHDPSGIDMTRDIRERLRLFARRFIGVDRIALNMDQIKHYKPPPNPTKLADSRAGGYVQEYGYDSWELDALEPSVIEGLVRHAVGALRDEALWDEAVEEEKEHREKLQEVADTWEGD